MSSELPATSRFNPDQITTEPLPIIDSHLSTTDEANSADAQYERIRLAPYIAAPLAVIALSFTIGNSETFANNISAATTHTEQNNSVSEVVSEIADLPLRVDCNDETLDKGNSVVENGLTYVRAGQVEPLHYLGAHVSLPVMTLRSDVCETIINFDTTPPDTEPSSNEYADYIMNAASYASAVGVALHESEHIKQVFNEAEATCYAFQKLPDTLKYLGMNERTAQHAAQLAFHRGSTRLMSEYYSDECRVGGAYDLGISTLYVHPEKSDIAKE